MHSKLSLPKSFYERHLNSFLKVFSMKRQTIALAAFILVGALPALAQERTEITINDTRVVPENLTSSSDGTIFFGSTAKGTIYRALPGASQADVWIGAEAAGLTNVTGVLADEKSNTLWVCANAPFGRGAAAATGQTALRAFDLKTGAAKGTYPFPDGGLSNDVAIAADGTAYVSDTTGGRVLRLKPSAQALDVWVTDPALRGIDGLGLLGDGALYVNNFFNGKLQRITVNRDSTAGPIVEIQTSLPFSRPDGLRTSGPKTLLQTEGSGRLTEITINGDRGEVRVIKEGLNSAAGVTQIGATAIVLVERSKALVVPMVASNAQAPIAPTAAATPPTQNGGAEQTHTKMEQQLLDLSKDKWRWMSERNVASLDALFHEEAVFVHMGATLSKKQELETIRSGAIQYKNAEIQEASMRFIGSTAIVLNRIRLVAVVGGNEVTNPFMVTEVYMRQGDSWKLGALSFTRLLGA